MPTFTLKDKIFGFFGVYAFTSDTQKDGQNKGIWQRYNESLGEDYDDNVQALIDDLLDNVIVPNLMLSKMIEMMESHLGIDIVLDDTDDLRRKMIQFFHPIGSRKSTLQSYDILFGILGMTSTTVTELVDVTGFDSDTTFDDDVRQFDGTTSCCREYSIALLGIPVIDQALTDAINRVNNFLSPLNAKTREITYNGTPIVLA